MSRDKSTDLSMIPSDYGVSYVIALIVVTIVMIYILDMPGHITGAHDLVQEYYYDNMMGSFVLDLFLIYAYIVAGKYLSSAVGFKSTATRVLGTVGATIGISSAFMFVFQSGYAKSTFFSRWFARVGWHAVLYDVILVTSVSVLSDIISKRIFSKGKI